MGYCLRPNNLDTTNSSNSQTTRVGYLVPGMTPPLLAREARATYPKDIPRGSEQRHTGPKNLPGTKQQTRAFVLEGATP
jgi:hypothetical protein